MKERFWRKTLSVCLALLMVAALVPSTLIISVSAASNTAYIYRWWDSDSNQVKSETRYADADKLQDFNNDLEALNAGWYYSSGYKVFDKRVTIHGTVNIIICDDASYVRFDDGIHVSPGNTLNIYGQEKGNQDFEAVAHTNDQAAIGGNSGEVCGTVNIYGGQVTADSYTSGDDAAGIGGGKNGGGGTVNIFGGTVTAKGANSSYDGGAGIGGGDSGSGGSVKIYGGTVNATGGHDGAGIGGGDDGSGGTISIYGGDVTANGNCAAGIGGGEYGEGGTISIYGGKVTATGGTDAAGIGGGDEKAGGTINIYDGNVTASGGSCAAGIGGGDNGSSGDIVIRGGTIHANGTAESSDGGAGIGGGNEKGANNIIVYDGDITAQGGADGAGIGGGDCGKGGNITIAGGTVNATGGKFGAGIGAGESGANITINITNANVTATGGQNGAGIGGGESADGGSVTIDSGTVIANGGDNGAAIGGGYKGNGGSVTINGGTVTANGGKTYKEDEGDVYCDGAAGIGGGYKGSGGTVEITGGEVTATGGYQAAGIGGGESGTSGDITISGGTVRAATTAHKIFYHQESAGAAAIGDGVDAGGDPVRSITISGGNIVAQTSGNYVEAQREGGAGIGAGYNGGGAENMKITITGCEKLVANGGPRAAGIGGSGGKYVGEISISGDVNITANGGRYAAGIGGGDKAASGKITISGGTVEAIGGGGAAGIGSGSGCTEDEKSVDITINGGNIKATGGGDFTYYNKGGYLAGASIGAGGCTREWIDDGPADIDDVSYFAGTVNLNGGTITANRTIGATHEAALDDATGIVNFDGATVQIETSEEFPSVWATTVTLKDDSGTPQKVSYKNSGSDPFISVPKDNRIAALQEKAKKIVLVSRCEHEDMVYTDNPYFAGNHTASCPHCNYSAPQPHEYGEPEWSWSENNLSATAHFPCVYCTHKITVEATVEQTSHDSTVGTVTCKATAEFEGETYTDIHIGFADELGARVAGHSLSLDGDIGVSFYMELSDTVANSNTAYMRFTIPKNSAPETKDIMVSDARRVESGEKTYYIFKCQVAAKEMTSEIKAQIIDGDKQGTEFTYSVKEYADYLLAHTDEREDFAKAVPLVKVLLNYGAYTQIFFDKNPGKLANADLTEEEKALDEVTIEIDEPVIDLPEGTTFEGATLSLKSETTLSLYFKSDDDLEFSCGGYTVETARSGKYQVARIRGIRATDIGDVFTLNVSGATVSYSPLNYCKSVLENDTQDEKLQNAAKSLYLYWDAADMYFYGIDISTVTGDVIAQDGDFITGTLSGNHKISIADGATVRLRNANITSLPDSPDAEYAGITLLGDATIILEGSNTVVGGYDHHPGIYVPVGKTITIEGKGSLAVSYNGFGYGCGIGGGYRISSGNIIINGGNITASGGRFAAGIGGGYGSCGSITINGGNVTATGGTFAAGIGGGFENSCGSITINNTVTQVTASRGADAPYSIGAGYGGSGGAVTIGGTEGSISESPYTYQPN